MTEERQRGRTCPPLRLRMVSSDVLCARSMEVEWFNGGEGRHRWVSCQDKVSSSWYEAEKLLPSSATDISVCFRSHVPGSSGSKVCAVDRHDGCAWLPETMEGRRPVEEIWLRSGPQEQDAGVDVIFELKGPLKGCYLRRAWNAARTGEPEYWESWDDEAARPSREPTLATLEAADGAAPRAACLGDAHLHFICTKKRMCAAVRELLDVHRRTVDGLRILDARFTHQWLGANTGNTASAALGIASAALLFTIPPVGVAVGVGAAVAGGLTFAGDTLADFANGSSLRSQMSRDTWNSFAVAELVEEWQRATEALGRISTGGWAPQGAPGHGMRDARDGQSMLAIAGQATDGGLAVSAVANGSAGTATRIASSFADIGAKAAAASQAVGILGAVIQTGMAIRGWSATKPGQAQVRRRIADLLAHVLQLQQLLSAIDWLECPVCVESIALTEQVRFCIGSAHCFHEQCLAATMRSASPACPCCASKLQDKGEGMVDAIEAWMRELREPPKSSSSRRAAAMVAAVAGAAARRHGRSIGDVVQHSGTGETPGASGDATPPSCSATRQAPRSSRSYQSMEDETP